MVRKLLYFVIKQMHNKLPGIPVRLIPVAQESLEQVDEDGACGDKPSTPMSFSGVVDSA